ncbi:2OG-Fe(II) oxygenase family protein [Streptomyces alanosinicus]|uniref:Oxidoreductase n=1 Tax=Streptomyces alanosinicus TaxID=68171 RepID=A0A918YVL8_9ACTN|nr:2OG-Fe(II) oxygenase family protein [Streptomyces alanosinicus]GHE15513.1 oxidoreductase [Streptomyces alanosinicus]
MAEGKRSGIPDVCLPNPGAGWTAEDKARAAAEIGAACRRGGYFFLRHHGVAADLLSAVYEETRQFYRLPVTEKSKYNASEQSQFLGYRGLGREKSTAHAGAEACEQYRIGNAEGALGMRIAADFYSAPFVNGACLFRYMVDLGDRVLSACVDDLGLGTAGLDSSMNSPMHRLGLNYYGVGHGEKIGNTVDYAMSPHVDLSIFTILAQNEPGLEVRGPEGDWICVPPAQDALFVFLGDYLQRWTNGLYVASAHRVRQVRGERLSIQYKHRPGHDAVVSPLSRFVDEGNPARYEPFDTGRQYASFLKSLLGSG